MAVTSGMIVKDSATAKNEASANTIYKISYVTTVKSEDADGDSTEKFGNEEKLWRAFSK
ncbi:hypothetical protein MY8738_003032 [Beauveria namnaoensis]